MRLRLNEGMTERQPYIDRIFKDNPLNEYADSLKEQLETDHTYVTSLQVIGKQVNDHFHHIFREVLKPVIDKIASEDEDGG